MQSYDEFCTVKLWPRAFAPLAGPLTVHIGAGLNGRSVPISLAACSDNT